MHCQKCDAQIERQDAFCSKCGELTRQGQPILHMLGGVGSTLSNIFKKTIGYAFGKQNRVKVIGGLAAMVVTIFALSYDWNSNAVSGQLSSYEGGGLPITSGTSASDD